MPRFLLDSGNFSDNPTPQGSVLTRALLDGMARMGYAAVNVGERDLQAGYAAFLDVVGERRFPFVSANIVRADTKEPVFPPSVTLEGDPAKGAPRVRVGVVGAARFNPLFRKPGPGGVDLVIVPPAEAVAREVARLRQQKVDVVVLLAALHRDDARRLGAEVTGIDFVVGSYGGDYTTTREQAGRSWILYSGNQGKRFGETRVYLRGETVEQDTTVHLLTASYPSDDEMQRIVDAIPRAAETPLPVVGAVSQPR